MITSAASAISASSASSAHSARFPKPSTISNLNITSKFSSSANTQKRKTPNPMDNDSAKPEITEFKGKPVLRIPTVDDPKQDVAWHWMSFGKNKAKAIVKWIEDIKKFAEE